MAKIFNWIKNNKLTFFLILTVVFLLLKNFFPFSGYKKIPMLEKAEFSYPQKTLPAVGSSEVIPETLPPPQEPPPTADLKNRLVIKESFLSLVVNNVVETQKQIIKKAQSLGGYLVSSDLNNPQESAYATIVIRVPSKKLDQLLQYCRGISVKIISENLQGQDVTDQYVDLEAKLTTLYKTKTKFEEIMDKAIKIEDILNIQREIINIQSQIDSLKGQQQYLEQNAKLAKLTIYLSTDELTLPYAPSEAWRPKVIFKQAVRSLIGNLRKVGTVIIWFGVYSVIWIPLVGIVFFLFRRWKIKK